MPKPDTLPQPVTTSIVLRADRRHVGPWRLPQFEFSDELVALLGRADRAEAQARRLCDENNWWRHSVQK